MATQQEIADRLKLSRSLVAGVLGNRDGIWASEETRQRIKTAAIEMNYRPNAAARALRSGKTKVVSLCVLPESQPAKEANWEPGGRDSLIEVLAKVLGRQGYRLQIDMESDWARAEESIREMVRTRSCDAFVLWGHEKETSLVASWLQAREIPFIVKGYYDDNDTWLQFEFDHQGMMREAVQHLVGLGHRRIVYLGHDNQLLYAKKLEMGWCEAMEEAGLDWNEDSIARTGLHHPLSERLESWLSLPETGRPTAFVIGSNDLLSWNQCEMALAKLGKKAGLQGADYALCGLRPAQVPLLFGQASGFDQAQLGDLTDTMCNQLLMPLLTDREISDQKVRFCPRLHQLESLELNLTTNY